MKINAFKYLLISFILLSALRAGAQQPGIFGIGLSGGAMNYKGDLDDDLLLKFTRAGGGVHFTFLAFTRFNISLNYLHGYLSCDDALAEQLANAPRNLSFFSNIDDFSALMTYRFQQKELAFSTRNQWVPYIFAGIGYFHFNPRRIVNGKEYELQKIGTEGQHLSRTTSADAGYPDPYRLWQFNIPFGAGIKYKLQKHYDLGFECGLRKTFTDYLDDVSGYYPDKKKLLSEQGEEALYLSDSSNDPRRPNGRASFSRRGDPDNKDWYIYTHLSITYYFTSKLITGRPTF